MDFREIQLAFLEIPLITRAYTTACFMTTIFVHLDVVTPYTLYYNLRLICMKYQIWRLVTPFCYFGPIGFPFLFNMIFTYKYCRMLEESSFRNRTFDMLVMFVFGAVLMLVAASFIDMFFLGQAFNIMFVYIWSRRNPHVQMNFFGMFDFTAPFLPWVLLAFGFLLGNSIEVDILGISVGHVYYFLEDVLPNQLHGYRVLNVQALVQLLNSRRQPAANQNANEANNAPQVDDAPRLRPGGFRWDAADG